MKLLIISSLLLIGCKQEANHPPSYYRRPLKHCIHACIKETHYAMASQIRKASTNTSLTDLLKEVTKMCENIYKGEDCCRGNRDSSNLSFKPGHFYGICKDAE